MDRYLQVVQWMKWSLKKYWMNCMRWMFKLWKTTVLNIVYTIETDFILFIQGELMMKKIMNLFILTFMVGLLVACGSPEAGSVENDVTENKTVTIEDSAGNNVEVPLDPQKVAVFDNGQLDNL